MKTKNSCEVKLWPLCASIAGLENVCSLALKKKKGEEVKSSLYIMKWEVKEMSANCEPCRNWKQNCAVILRICTA